MGLLDELLSCWGGEVGLQAQQRADLVEQRQFLVRVVPVVADRCLSEVVGRERREIDPGEFRRPWSVGERLYSPLVRRIGQRLMPAPTPRPPAPSRPTATSVTGATPRARGPPGLPGLPPANDRDQRR